MGDLDVISVVDEGLGNSAYLVAYAADTHLRADFLTGAVQLARTDGAQVLAHGAGSFCSAPPGVERTSTIATERAMNTLLRAASEDAFVTQLLDSLGTFPPYFLRLGEINRRGPAAVEGDTLTPLTPSEVTRLTASGAQLVDVRPVLNFGAGHSLQVGP